MFFITHWIDIALSGISVTFFNRQMNLQSAGKVYIISPPVKADWELYKPNQLVVFP